ncbi:MAG: hypothetical protein CFH44_00934, partial [Proteobacteria bacterium]
PRPAVQPSEDELKHHLEYTKGGWM